MHDKIQNLFSKQPSDIYICIFLGDQSNQSLQRGNSEYEEEEDSLGGLFKVVNRKNNEIVQNKDKMDAIDSSKFVVTQIRDWNKEEVHNFFI